MLAAGLGIEVAFVVLVDVTGVMLFEHVAPLDRCLPRGWFGHASVLVRTSSSQICARWRMLKVPYKVLGV